ncbi:MAG: caspase family protein [Anaerolineales bacterium]|nr:caspase family protein [Anaerolineales bacterium]
MTRQALLIANSISYSESRHSIPAAAVKRTVNRFARLLEELPQNYRFNVTQLRDARAKDARSTANVIAERAAKSGDLFLFYYFGHGQLSSDLELQFLHPSEQKGFFETLRLSTIENEVKAAEARKSLFIVDCCYAGAQYRTFPTILNGEHCRIASTTPSARAYVLTNIVKDPIGIFTRSIIDGLTSKNATVSATNNNITAESLFNFAKKETKNNTNNTQDPQKTGSLAEPLTIWESKPEIVKGVSNEADEKTAYKKILIICRVLALKKPPKNLEALYKNLTTKHLSSFQTLHKLEKGKFEYLPVKRNVISRYIRLLRSLELLEQNKLQLTGTGKKLATNWSSSYNLLLLNAIDKYLQKHGISRETIEHSLYQILSSRGVPSKVETLDYLSLGRTLSKDELGTILDILGYMRAIRMSTGHAYFPW